jgi:hypothetical protein
VLDLPNVIKKTDTIIAEEPEEVRSRIHTKGLSASFDWNVEDGAFDVVSPVAAYLQLFVFSQCLNIFACRLYGPMSEETHSYRLWRHAMN